MDGCPCCSRGPDIRPEEEAVDARDARFILFAGVCGTTVSTSLLLDLDCSVLRRFDPDSDAMAFAASAAAARFVCGPSVGNSFAPTFFLPLAAADVADAPLLFAERDFVDDDAAAVPFRASCLSLPEGLVFVLGFITTCSLFSLYKNLGAAVGEL